LEQAKMAYIEEEEEEDDDDIKTQKNFCTQ
jgi:hypothetical protein